jgi:Leucine-rich repeat (LRR) protein
MNTFMYGLASNIFLHQLSDAFALLEGLESFSVTQNDIVGSVPAAIFASKSLKAVDLSNNAFFGVLPQFAEGTTVEILDLSSNNLSGQIQPNIENAASLRSLNLANNALNGALPPQLFNLPLLDLNLESNFFSGQIPTAIQEASSLLSLTLGPNQFTGDIPVSMNQLTSLVKLSIRDIPDLGGRLPASYGLALTNLIEWTITGTSIRGNIPDFIGGLTNLEILDFSENRFFGDLPPGLGLLTNLRKCPNMIDKYFVSCSNFVDFPSFKLRTIASGCK